MILNIPDGATQGITGNIYYSYSNAVNIIPMIVQFFGLLVVIAAVVLMLLYLMKLTYPNSKRYTCLLSNLYVAGKIKQIAKEDNIDLLSEFKEYAAFNKKIRNATKEIDSVIAEELKEKIAEKTKASS